MDAGRFAKIKNDESSSYTEIPAHKLGSIIATVANEQNQSNFIYGWSAFLLNHSSEYFAENLVKGQLLQMKELYHKQDFTCYQPKHPTLTIYSNGNKYFSDKQNELIKWFSN